MKNIDKRNPENWTWEEKNNFVGFFALLVKVDRRINPHLYKKKATHEKGQPDILEK